MNFPQTQEMFTEALVIFYGRWSPSFVLHHACFPAMCIADEFKNACAFLLRDARHAMHDILLLRISAILPEAISDGGLTPTTDTDLLLATYRDGSHFTSDILQIFISVSHLCVSPP